MANFLFAVQLFASITFRAMKYLEYGPSYILKIYRILLMANDTQVHVYLLIPSASAKNRNLK